MQKIKTTLWIIPELIQNYPSPCSRKSQENIGWTFGKRSFLYFLYFEAFSMIIHDMFTFLWMLYIFLIFVDQGFCRKKHSQLFNIHVWKKKSAIPNSYNFFYIKLMQMKQKPIWSIYHTFYLCANIVLIYCSRGCKDGGQNSRWNCTDRSSNFSFEIFSISRSCSKYDVSCMTP